MNREIKFEILQRIELLDVYTSNSSNTQHVIRCPYCEQFSQKEHGHFSIKIDVDNDEPMLYRCFKCESKGILTSLVLDDIGISYDANIASELKSFNKKAIGKNHGINMNIPKLSIPIYNKSKLSDTKLNYINNRLGTFIDYNKASELNIILDLFEFMKLNDMTTIPNISYKYMKFINMNYVGFLAKDNNCIVFRLITNIEGARRYVKVILNSSLINTGASFYTIKNNIDLFYTNDINIRIAEGTFDILSVYYNVERENLNRNYYFASCGYGYLGIIRYLLYNGITTGLHLHIYADKDKTDSMHLKMLEGKYYPWIDHITIHRNIYKNEKDYGVKKEFIIDGKCKYK